MKKFLALFAVIFVVAFAGASFAATGGHVPDNYKSIDITTEKVGVPAGVSVDHVVPLSKAEATREIAKFTSSESATPVSLAVFSLICHTTILPPLGISH